MGRSSISKGKSFERIWRRILEKVGFVGAERNIGETRSDLLGLDVIAESQSILLVSQVKNRRSPSVWKALREAESAARELQETTFHSKAIIPIAVVKRIRDRTMVCMPPYVALALIQAADSFTGKNHINPLQALLDEIRDVCAENHCK